jgi:hypothetical protein
MIVDDQEKHFLEEARDLLNKGVENLDSRATKRLGYIRTNALRAVEEKASRFFLSSRWLMFGGLATATMAAVVFFFWLNPSPVDFPVRHIEDFEIITSKDRIDFYQDLEFYRWMTTQNGPTQAKAL